MLHWHAKEHPNETAEDYLVRLAEPKDARGVIMCMQSVMDERIYLVGEYYMLTEKGEQERLKNPDDATFVCEKDDQIIGVLTLQRGFHRKNRHTANLGIAIKKGHRHKGIGTKLMQKSFEWCKQNGIKKLNLEVFSSNTNAIELYKKLGFEEEGRRKDQFFMEGTYVDDVFMTKYF
jgi:hypothetical protein